MTAVCLPSLSYLATYLKTGQIMETIRNNSVYDALAGSKDFLVRVFSPTSRKGSQLSDGPPMVHCTQSIQNSPQRNSPELPVSNDDLSTTRICQSDPEGMAVR